MADELSIEDLKYVKSGGPTDEELMKLDGTRVKIIKVEIISDTSKYKDGSLLPEGQEVEVKKLQLETESFGNELIGREIVHRERYNLSNKDGEWIVSLHEKAKTAQFLAKYNLESFAKVVGTEVVLTKRTNPDSKRSWLSISI